MQALPKSVCNEGVYGIYGAKLHVCTTHVAINVAYPAHVLDLHQ